MLTNDNAELQTMKANISLADFARDHGYSIIKKRSSKSSICMKNGDTKIIIARRQSGEDVFFSPSDPGFQGTVIDFVKKERNCSLGVARQILRPLAGISQPAVPASRAKKSNHRFKIVRKEKPAVAAPPQKEAAKSIRPVAVSKSKEKILRTYWKEVENAVDSRYLIHDRYLSTETIELFADSIFQDSRRNICFVHREIEDFAITGWEMKNNGFTGFAKGGTKSLFICAPDDSEGSRLILAESAIDVMSFSELFGRKGDVYVSFGGGLSPAQIAQIETLIQESPSIVIATDNDEGGDKFAELFSVICKKHNKMFSRIKPTLKDFNNDLKLKKEYGNDY